MKKSVVLDTNIIVSAALTSTGNSSEIVALVSAGELKLFFSLSILDEYRRVLGYSKLNIAPSVQSKMLARLEAHGIIISPIVSTFSMPDESDRIFYDAAVAVGATLITGNMKHYPQTDFIVTPSAFMEQYNAKP